MKPEELAIEIYELERDAANQAGKWGDLNDRIQQAYIVTAKALLDKYDFTEKGVIAKKLEELDWPAEQFEPWDAGRVHVVEEMRGLLKEILPDA